MKNSLHAVPSDLPDPPYPADKKANGWKPEFDIDRIYQSDTWTLAEPEEKPWLLRIWMESWRSVPVGSMPKELNIFARRIGCTRQFLEAHREALLRGWVLHSDGRLYHEHISGQIYAMLEKRHNKAERVKAYRQKQQEKQRRLSECSGNVLASSTQEQEQEQEQEQGKKEKACSTIFLPKNSTRSTCPYEKIVSLWDEILPELPSVVKLTPARKSQIKARWLDELPDLDAWRECFGYVRESKFLMGKTDPPPGRQRFVATLDWVSKQANLVKIYEGKYDG